MSKSVDRGTYQKRKKAELKKKEKVIFLLSAVLLVAVALFIGFAVLWRPIRQTAANERAKAEQAAQREKEDREAEQFLGTWYAENGQTA